MKNKNKIIGAIVAIFVIAIGYVIFSGKETLFTGRLRRPLAPLSVTGEPRHCTTSCVRSFYDNILELTFTGIYGANIFYPDRHSITLNFIGSLRMPAMPEAVVSMVDILTNRTVGTGIIQYINSSQAFVLIRPTEKLLFNSGEETKTYRFVVPTDMLLADDTTAVENLSVTFNLGSSDRTGDIRYYNRLYGEMSWAGGPVTPIVVNYNY